ncbi:hypothetical protein DBT_1382 [Dissulfuribacter thermophilus]|uniref:Uncharacterized protein n=1 Tax=Dissulfuribacter thermophilus TaxID=1156395 RepID=A0A1B9F5P7_9BACT|nr:hypothetical protein DBT_1382 [Dissulfuribacter thermophilus]
MLRHTTSFFLSLFNKKGIGLSQLFLDKKFFINMIELK